MNTDSLQIMLHEYIKTEDIYSDFTTDVETRSDTSNFQLDRPLPKGKNKTVVGLTEDVLDAKIMMDIVELRSKKYGYLLDDSDENKNN